MSRAVSSGGAVASISSEASAVGIDVLNHGGNAVDAAVAMVFAVGVVNTSAGGIGGDGFLVYRGQDDEVAALDFRAAAPERLDASVFEGTGMHKEAAGTLSPTSAGHHIVGVPSVVAAMAETLQKYGTIPLGTAIGGYRHIRRGDLQRRGPVQHGHGRSGSHLDDSAGQERSAAVVTTKALSREGSMLPSPIFRGPT